MIWTENDYIMWKIQNTPGADVWIGFSMISIKLQLLVIYFLFSGFLFTTWGNDPIRTTYLETFVAQLKILEDKEDTWKDSS